MRIDKKQKKKEIVLKIIVTFGLVKILIEVTTMSNKTKRYFLPEEEIPHYWYNIQADMVNKPMPPLHPGTKQPLKAEDLYPIFAQELCKQELNQTDKWIDPHSYSNTDRASTSDGHAEQNYCKNDAFSLSNQDKLLKKSLHFAKSPSWIHTSNDWPPYAYAWRNRHPVTDRSQPPSYGAPASISH